MAPAPVSPYRIVPLRPIADVRAAALAADPPTEPGDFRTPDLVDVDPTIRRDVRYATENNFLGTPLYPEARVLLQRPAAEALARVQRGLAADGLGLVVYDGYRPWYVTKMFWDATPDHLHTFVATPSWGSRHNRGCAVDLSLVDRTTGVPVPMPSDYDEFTERAYPDYAGGTAEERRNRDRLRAAMEAERFTVNDAEWWHYDFEEWRSYPILNLDFGDVAPWVQRR